MNGSSAIAEARFLFNRSRTNEFAPMRAVAMVLSVLLIAGCVKTEYRLRQSIADDDTKSVRRILDAGTSVDTMLSPEAPHLPTMSLLHWAIRSNAMGTAELLIDRNADPNLSDSQGRTPIMYLVNFGNMRDKRVVGLWNKLLRLEEIDLSSADADGNRLVGFVCEYESVPAKMLEELLAKGISVGPNSRGATPLHILAGSPSPKTEASLQKVNLLLSAGTDINAKNSDGQTALDLALSSPGTSGMDRLVDLLRSKGGKTGQTVGPETE